MERLITRRKLDYLNRIVLPLHALDGYNSDERCCFYIAVSDDKTQIILRKVQITDENMEMYKDMPVYQANELGMVFIPDRIQLLMDIKQYTEFDIYLNNETNSFILHKVIPCCMLCGKTDNLATIHEFVGIRHSCYLCKHCIKLVSNYK